MPFTKPTEPYHDYAVALQRALDEISIAIGPGSTVSASGTLVDNAIVTGHGTAVVQTPSPSSTLDASGNMVLAGSLTSILATIDAGNLHSPADGLILTNSAPAVVGVDQVSPQLRWHTEGWKTNATAGSQPLDFEAQLWADQGTAHPSGRLAFSAQVNGAGY